MHFVNGLVTHPANIHLKGVMLMLLISQYFRWLIYQARNKPRQVKVLSQYLFRNNRTSFNADDDSL